MILMMIKVLVIFLLKMIKKIRTKITKTGAKMYLETRKKKSLGLNFQKT